jgi:elongation factor P
MPKINGNAVRPGIIIEHQGRLWACVRAQHTQPGKGGAYLQAELKDIREGTKLNVRFRSSETVEQVFLDQHDYQYLFSEGDMHTFMDMETFEQITLDGDIVSEDQVPYLQEGMTVVVQSHEDRPLSMTIPLTVVLEVVEADAAIKGQTAASSYKPAKLANGIRILVPPYIETGTRVVVNTAEGSYVERAKD